MVSVSKMKKIRRRGTCVTRRMERHVF